MAKNEEKNLLILFDNFQVSLASRINFFSSFVNLIRTINELNEYRITIRLHNAFFNYYNKSSISDELKANYFFNTSIQSASDIPLKNVIQDYDIVIGPLTTCIFEAMWAKVFFIPYVPEYFPASSLENLENLQWFKGLYPQICINAQEIKEILNLCKLQYKKEYEKYLSSIDEIGFVRKSKTGIFEIINPKTVC